MGIHSLIMKSTVMKRLILSLILILCGAAGVGHSYASEQILERYYLEDKNNRLTLEQVENAQMSSFGEVLVGGYKTGAYWIKLKILSSPQELVLKVRPAYLDQIELYDPAFSSKTVSTGAEYPWSSQYIEASSFNFLLPPSTKNRDIFLRIKTRQSYLAYIELMTATQYLHADRINQMLYMAFAMLTFILAIWLFITWLMNREIVLGVFVIQQFFAFMHTFFKIGFARIYFDSFISDESISTIGSLLSVAFPLVGFIANKLLLSEYGLKPRFKSIFNLIIFTSIVILILQFGGFPIALKFNAWLVLSTVTYFCIASIFGVERESFDIKSKALSIRTLQIFYSVSMIFWILAILPLLGLMPFGEVAIYSMYVYSVCSGLIFFFLLQIRSKALLKQEITRSNEMGILADQERRRREEQSMLMAMLSHEIKTPLSVLKLVVDQRVAGSDLEGHANRAVSNINFIVNRCLQLGKLDAKEIHLHPSNINIYNLVMEVANDSRVIERTSIFGNEALTFYIDEDLLRVVLSNLMENAMKYSADGSSINLSFEPSPRNERMGIVFTIANIIGPMGAPDPQQVFKKYYRNSSATKISGSGLGLFLVREIAHVLEGQIFYRQEEGRVIFELWVPA